MFSHKIKIACKTTLFSALCSLAPSAFSTSLMDVYKEALDNDYTYQAAKANYAAQSQDKNIARAGILPNVRGNVSWTDSSGDSTDFTETPSSTINTESTRTSYSLSLDQALFDLSSWNDYQSGKVSYDIAKLTFDEAGQNLILRVSRAYFNALAAVDNLETAKAEEKALSLQLDQTRQRFEVGLTAITDVHEAQAVFDTSTASRLTAEGDVEIAFEELGVISGQQYSALNPLKAGFPVVPPEPNNRVQWVEFALKYNLDLQASELNFKASKYNYKSAKAAHLPSLSASLSYSGSDSLVERNRITTADSDSDETQIRLNLNVPIYAGGRNHAQRKRAEARSLRQKALLNQTKRSVTQEARSGFIQVVTGVSTVKARALAIRSNESALEATQAGYDVGTRDLIDVLQAQQNLFRARRNYSNVLFSYVINTLRLKQTAGTLSVTDLKALSDWLDLNKNVYKKF